MATAILHADDDENDALLIRLALTKAQLVVELRRVRTGQEVLDCLCGVGVYANRSRWPLPRLLLLDWNMPGLDGLGVLSWVRSSPSFRNLPVRIVSGADDPTARLQALSLGAAFVPKTSDFRSVADHVRSILASNVMTWTRRFTPLRLIKLSD